MIVAESAMRDDVIQRKEEETEMKKMLRVLSAVMVFMLLICSVALAEPKADKKAEKAWEKQVKELEKVVKEEVTSTIEVQQVFRISKVGLVAGAMVRDGKVKRSDKARLIRDGIVIFTGSINALKRFKDDVKEVTTNFECGISLVNYNDLREGDILETFQEIEVKAKL